MVGGQPWSLDAPRAAIAFQSRPRYGWATEASQNCTALGLATHMSASDPVSGLALTVLSPSSQTAPTAPHIPIRACFASTK